MACHNCLQVKPPHHTDYVSVPCGWCSSCRADYRKSWTYRINKDLQRFEYSGRTSSFVTFTYDDQYLPRDGSIHKDQAKAFLDRARHLIKYHLPAHSDYKYWLTGEYGGTFGRPHYHVLFIGLPLSSCYPLAKCWPYGFIDCLPLLPGGIEYVLKYVDKQVHGDLAKEIFGDMEPPFSLKSKGFGSSDLLDNLDYYKDHVTYPNNGYEVPIPRYYRDRVNSLLGFRPAATTSMDNIKLKLNQASLHDLPPPLFLARKAMSDEMSKIAKSRFDLDRESPLEDFTLVELQHRYAVLSNRYNHGRFSALIEDIYND